MTGAGDSNIAVVLVDVPGFLDEVLSRELGDQTGFDVMRVDDPQLTIGERRDAVLVVRATLGSLKRAPVPLPDLRVVGTIAVTEGEGSRGDAYLVSPAGKNVSHRELAQIIRKLAAERSAEVAAVKGDDQVFSRSEP
jgi:hypothetical protein